jgi:hypothetical protein
MLTGTDLVNRVGFWTGRYHYDASTDIPKRYISDPDDVFHPYNFPYDLLYTDNFSNTNVYYRPSENVL